MVRADTFGSFEREKENTMAHPRPIQARLIVLLGSLSAGWGSIGSALANGEGKDTPSLRAEFFQLCDAACRELNTPTRRVPFYQDSYAVRGLAVAHDLGGNEKYLDMCRAWSDRMIAFQEKMIPRGAYYMNYGRKPGEERGEWYVADSASIALGVLATAVRCKDPAAKERYRRSAESFAQLVIDNYVRGSGGVTDGFWSQFDGEWWCSTGIFGSLALVLYEETGKERYRNVGLGALGWLNRLEIRKAEHISFDEAAPTVIMYVWEAYSAGWPHLEARGELKKGALAQTAVALDWMAANQAGRAGSGRWNYNSQWGSKLGGLPFHMSVFARQVAGNQEIAAAADRELAHVSKLLFGKGPPSLSQLAAFAMMSYAEKLSPGAMYRRWSR
jgi:hypothetical protein